MADIKLERNKGGMGWLWALLAILLLALIAWWIWSAASDRDGEVGSAEYGTELGTERYGTGFGTEPSTALPPATAGQARLGEILADPQSWVGRDFPGGEVDVAEVPSDRGFWISDGGERLFAVLIDQPREQPVDVNPGQRLRVDGGTLRDASYLPQIEGETPLDAATRQAVEGQPIYLVVDEDDIEILETAEAQAGTDRL